VGDKKKKSKKAASFSTFLTLVKGAAYNVSTGPGTTALAMPALRPAGTPNRMALPAANSLLPPEHKDVQKQVQQPMAPTLQNRPQNPSLQPTIPPAGSRDIQVMLAQYANQLLNPALNKGQAMPQKNATALPTQLQALCRLTSDSREGSAGNSAGTLLDSAASAAQQVLEKCAQLRKQALPYQQQRYGFRPMQPNQGDYGDPGMSVGSQPQGQNRYPMPAPGGGQHFQQPRRRTWEEARDQHERDLEELDNYADANRDYFMRHPGYYEALVNKRKQEWAQEQKFLATMGVKPLAAPGAQAAQPASDAGRLPLAPPPMPPPAGLPGSHGEYDAWGRVRPQTGFAGSSFADSRAGCSFWFGRG